MTRSISIAVRHVWSRIRARDNALGRALLRRGKAEEALVEFRDAARLDPDNAEIRYNLGAVLLEQGRTSEAIAQLRQAMALRPDLLPAVSTLAWVLATAPTAALRNASEALRLAERAVALTRRRDAAVLDVLRRPRPRARFDDAVTFAMKRWRSDRPPACRKIRRRQEHKQRQPYVSKSDALRIPRPLHLEFPAS